MKLLVLEQEVTRSHSREQSTTAQHSKNQQPAGGALEGTASGLPDEEEEDERAGAGASRLEPAAAAEAPAGGHEHGLRDGEQEQRADAVARGDVGVVDAVRVVLLRVRGDDGRAAAALGGHAQPERDHVQEDDHHLHDDGRHRLGERARERGFYWSVFELGELGGGLVGGDGWGARSWCSPRAS